MEEPQLPIAPAFELKAADASDLIDAQFVSADVQATQHHITLPRQATHRPYPLKRNKRSLNDIETTSSDPPMFSSDGPEPSAEDYFTHRRKRQHQRTWFDGNASARAIDVESASPRKRSGFKRNLDSGIFMGSEDSIEPDFAQQAARLANPWAVDDEVPNEIHGGDEDLANVANLDLSASSEDGHDPQFAKSARLAREVPDGEDPMNFLGPVFPYWQEQPEDLDSFHNVQASVYDEVLRLAEQGNEVFDLSNVCLMQIRNPVLRPLRFHVKPFSPASCAPLTPCLKLLLAGNNLSEAPGELYHLRNLTVLSLRNNELTEIMPAVAQLTSLTELNVGGNRLRYLPFELLSLRKMFQLGRTCLTVHPNPFIRPWPSTWLPPSTHVPLEKSSDSLSNNQKRLRPIAVTPIAFLDVLGNPVPDSPPAPSQENQYWCAPSTKPESLFVPLHDQRNRTSSLLELCLRSLLHHPTLSQVPFLMHRHAPAHLKMWLKRAFRLCEADASLSRLGCAVVAADPVEQALLSPCSEAEAEAPTGVRQLAAAEEQEVNEGKEEEVKRARKAEIELRQAESRLFPSTTGQRCTICHNQFVIPRTEWIEWWSLSRIHPSYSPFSFQPTPLYNPAHNDDSSNSSTHTDDESYSYTDSSLSEGARQKKHAEEAAERSAVPIPFLRRGCSWACFEDYRTRVAFHQQIPKKRKGKLAKREENEEAGEEPSGSKPVILMRGWRSDDGPN